jgi:hypothetical protein
MATTKSGVRGPAPPNYARVTDLLLSVVSDLNGAARGATTVPRAGGAAAAAAASANRASERLGADPADGPLDLSATLAAMRYISANGEVLDYQGAIDSFAGETARTVALCVASATNEAAVESVSRFTAKNGAVLVYEPGDMGDATPKDRASAMSVFGAAVLVAPASRDDAVALVNAAFGDGSVDLDDAGAFALAVLTQNDDGTIVAGADVSASYAAPIAPSSETGGADEAGEDAYAKLEAERDAELAAINAFVEMQPSTMDAAASDYIKSRLNSGESIAKVADAFYRAYAGGGSVGHLRTLVGKMYDTRLMQLEEDSGALEAQALANAAAAAQQLHLERKEREAEREAQKRIERGLRLEDVLGNETGYALPDATDGGFDAKMEDVLEAYYHGYNGAPRIVGLYIHDGGDDTAHLDALATLCNDVPIVLVGPDIPSEASANVRFVRVANASIVATAFDARVGLDANASQQNAPRLAWVCVRTSDYSVDVLHTNAFIPNGNGVRVGIRTYTAVLDAALERAEYCTPTATGIQYLAASFRDISAAPNTMQLVRRPYLVLYFGPISVDDETYAVCTPVRSKLQSLAAKGEIAVVQCATDSNVVSDVYSLGCDMPCVDFSNGRDPLDIIARAYSAVTRTPEPTAPTVAVLRFDVTIRAYVPCGSGSHVKMVDSSYTLDRDSIDAEMVHTEVQSNGGATISEVVTVLSCEHSRLMSSADIPDLDRAEEEGATTSSVNNVSTVYDAIRIYYATLRSVADDGGGYDPARAAGGLVPFVIDVIRYKCGDDEPPSWLTELERATNNEHAA